MDDMIHSRNPTAQPKATIMLEHPRTANQKLDKNKIQLANGKITILGHKLPQMEPVLALPINIKKLQRFLGTIKYLSKYPK